MAEDSLARSSSDTNMKWRAAGPAVWATISWALTRRDRWASVIDQDLMYEQLMSTARAKRRK